MMQLMRTVRSPIADGRRRKTAVGGECKLDAASGHHRRPPFHICKLWPLGSRQQKRRYCDHFVKHKVEYNVELPNDRVNLRAKRRWRSYYTLLASDSQSLMLCFVAFIHL